MSPGLGHDPLASYNITAIGESRMRENIPASCDELSFSRMSRYREFLSVKSRVERIVGFFNHLFCPYKCGVMRGGIRVLRE